MAERQRTADEKTAEAAARVVALGRDLLLSVLELPVFDVRDLRIAPDHPVFRPGSLAVAGAAPDWAEYAPPAPGLVGRLVGGGRYQRDLKAARAQWALP